MCNLLRYGTLIISLDFEMMWGCHDWATIENYGATNIANVRNVIDRMLCLFNKYGVHATFATVGLIMCKDAGDVEKYAPSVKPSYLDSNQSPYKGSYIKDIKDKDAELYFAPDLIERLQQAKGIEIGTHTFSHYFCWEKGQTTDQFRADLSSMVSVANDRGVRLSSIVFPKNQVSPEYLRICQEFGIMSYRGNAVKYYSEPSNRWEHIKQRMCRLLDAYVNLGGMTGVPYDEIVSDEKMLNLRASRMLRPFSQELSLFEGLRFRRIQKEMIDAAKNHKMYHIWWHPHNFGANMEQNLAFLERVLKCYNDCHIKYNMQSYTMDEMKNIIMLNRNV